MSGFIDKTYSLSLKPNPFEATFLLYSRVARVATKLPIGTARGGDSQNDCPANTADWFPWQGSVEDS